MGRREEGRHTGEWGGALEARGKAGFLEVGEEAPECFGEEVAVAAGEKNVLLCTARNSEATVCVLQLLSFGVVCSAVDNAVAACLEVVAAVCARGGCNFAIEMKPRIG